MARAVAVAEPEGAPETEPGWISWQDVDPWAGNPNIHPEFQPELIAESIRAFGFVAPIVIWPAKGRLVAGHGRLQAMRLICESGYGYIDAEGSVLHRNAEPGFTAHGSPGPGLMRVVYHDFPSEAAANAYTLADNEIAKGAHWDDAKVAALLKELHADEAFTALHAIGFPQADLDALLADPGLPPEPVGLAAVELVPAPAPAMPEPSAAEPSERTPTLVDFVVPMAVAERAKCHGAVNLAKRVSGVTTAREAVLLIIAEYEAAHAGRGEP